MEILKRKARVVSVGFPDDESIVQMGSNCFMDVVPVKLSGNRLENNENKWKNLKRWLNTHARDHEDSRNRINDYREYSNIQKIEKFLDIIVDDPDSSFVWKSRFSAVNMRILERMTERKIRCAVQSVVRNAVHNKNNESWENFVNGDAEVYLYDKLSSSMFEEVSKNKKSNKLTIFVMDACDLNELKNELMAFVSRDTWIRVIVFSGSIEEDVLKRFFEHLSTTETKIETMYRVAAAKTTAPNRLN